MKRVLVLDANLRSALAVVRSLGKKGVPVITADELPCALAGRSRYSTHYHAYPSPQVQARRFVQAVSELCDRHNIDIVFPMTELTSGLLLAHRAAFESATLPFAGRDTVSTLADKRSLMRLAASLKIPAPETWFVDDPARLPVELYDLPYPLVIKPAVSWLVHEGRWLHTSVRIADDAASAAEILASDPAFQGHPFMFQAYVPGNGEGVFTLYDHARPLAFFAHRRLREKPPGGGISVLSESVAVDPALEAYARKLLDHVGWHGVAMVEFRVTPDGRPYLMEVNTRFWGSLQLAIDAGVDFPWLLYRLASGEPVEPVTDYRKGVRLRWLLGDLDVLYLVLRDSRYSLKRKMHALGAFLGFSPFRTHHEVNRWGDMGPARLELKQYLKDLFG